MKYQTQLHLCLTKENDHFCLSSNPSHLSLNQLDGNINRKLLEAFKNHALAHQQLLIENQEFSIFNFLIWLSDEIKEFSKLHWFTTGSQEVDVQDEEEEVYGMMLKVDHIRSTSRYYKFFKDAS